MKNMTRFFVIIAMVVIIDPAIAQETQNDVQPGFFVLHQNQIAIEDMAQVNAMADSVIVPILDELVEEDLLLGWGQLNHAWGDEWNYNFYFITENHRAFLNFWDEYVSLINERHPGYWQQTSSLLQSHRDNMYSIGAMGGVY